MSPGASLEHLWEAYCSKILVVSGIIVLRNLGASQSGSDGMTGEAHV